MRPGHETRSKRENWKWLIIALALAIIFAIMLGVFANSASVANTKQDKSPQVSAWAPVYGAEEKVVFNTTKNSGLVARVYLDPANKQGAGLVVSVFHGNGSEKPIFKLWGLNTSKEQMAYQKEGVWISGRNLATQLYVRSPHLTLVGVKMIKPAFFSTPNSPEVEKMEIRVLDSKGKVNGAVSIDFTK